MWLRRPERFAYVLPVCRFYGEGGGADKKQVYFMKTLSWAPAILESVLHEEPTSLS
jgi:hypothetical protein